MPVTEETKFGDFLASDVYRALNKGRKVPNNRIPELPRPVSFQARNYGVTTTPA